MKKIKLIIVTISLLQLQSVKPCIAASIYMLCIESQRREAASKLALLEKKEMNEQENLPPHLENRPLEHNNAKPDTFNEPQNTTT